MTSSARVIASIHQSTSLSLSQGELAFVRHMSRGTYSAVDSVRCPICTKLPRSMRTNVPRSSAHTIGRLHIHVRIAHRVEGNQTQPSWRSKASHLLAERASSPRGYNAFWALS